MTLLLKTADIWDILPMEQAIEDMEITYKEHGQGVAVNALRQRIYSPRSEVGKHHFFNNLMGSVPHFKALALRINSIGTTRREVAGEVDKQIFTGNYVGLALLFSTETNELLAVLDDHYLSNTRVAAVNALTTKYLARSDSSVLGLFGSGFQARSSLLATLAVRSITEIKVYSPNAERRAKFCREMTEMIGQEVRAAENSKEVVQGSDIVIAATSSNIPVYDGHWLEPGTHVITITGGDSMNTRDEADFTTYERSDLIFVTSREQIGFDRQGNIFPLMQSGRVRKVYELGDLVNGHTPRRTSDEQIIFFKNNAGMGIQFVPVAWRIYQIALERGIGRELPDDYFMTFRDASEVYAP